MNKLIIATAIIMLAALLPAQTKEVKTPKAPEKKSLVTSEVLAGLKFRNI